jgi:dipeptidyl aminopeptidase/acylaminoacyl peptidase
MRGIVLFFLVFCPKAALALEAGPLPLNRASISSSSVVFSYAGDLWAVPRQGGDAKPLTQGPEYDDHPLFSPDGASVAFARDWGGASDLFVISASGGVARQLTWPPKADVPRAWSPDGTSILFSSDREGDGLYRLYTIPRDGVWEVALPLPSGTQASWSPDGQRLAYLPVPRFSGWRNYRGGSFSRIWIVDMAQGDLERIPNEGWNDFQPMWIGETVYFLSDRSHTENLYAYSTSSRAVRQLTSFEKFGIESASSRRGRKGRDLHLGYKNGRRPQPDGEPARRRPHAGLVAGWEMDRLVHGCIGRIRLGNSILDRCSTREDDPHRSPAQLLQRDLLVPRFAPPRRLGQASQLVGR